MEEKTSNKPKKVAASLSMRIDPALRERLDNYRRKMAALDLTERRVIELAIEDLFNNYPELEDLLQRLIAATGSSEAVA